MSVCFPFLSQKQTLLLLCAECNHTGICHIIVQIIIKIKGQHVQSLRCQKISRIADVCPLKLLLPDNLLCHCIRMIQRVAQNLQSV